MARMTGKLHAHICISMIKWLHCYTIDAETQSTRCIFSSIFYENRAVYEIMSKNMVQADRSHTTA